eukprot:IDg14822t1
MISWRNQNLLKRARVQRSLGCNSRRKEGNAFRIQLNHVFEIVLQLFGIGPGCDFTACSASQKVALGCSIFSMVARVTTEVNRNAVHIFVVSSVVLLKY